MKLTDISRRLQEAPVYPGSPPLLIEKTFDIENGDPFSESVITAGSHMGTHADAARHYLPENAAGIDEIELYHYYGPCRVVTVAANALITKEALAGRLEGCLRLVIHSGGNSYLTKEAAEFIAERQLLTVVTDAMSIAPPDNEEEIHRIILRHGIAIVENVVLDGVPDGDYIISAFPIKIGGCDGAPVRAVLISET